MKASTQVHKWSPYNLYEVLTFTLSLKCIKVNLVQILHIGQFYFQYFYFYCYCCCCCCFFFFYFTKVTHTCGNANYIQYFPVNKHKIDVHTSNRHAYTPFVSFSFTLSAHSLTHSTLMTKYKCNYCVIQMHSFSSNVYFGRVTFSSFNNFTCFKCFSPPPPIFSFALLFSSLFSFHVCV